MQDVSINGVDDLLAAQGPDFVLDLFEKAKLADVSTPPGFRISDSGVYSIDPSGEKDDIWICSPLYIIASTRSNKNEDWGQLLQFRDKDGNEHSWAMPMAMLAGDGSGYRERLLSMGLQIAPGRKARELLTTYIQTANPDERARCVERVGWYKGVFVLPDETIGNQEDEHVIFQSAIGAKHKITIAGTLDDWRENVGRLCSGNSRLVFATSCAFAGPVLQLVSEGSGGFHFRGLTSTGKTTALLVAGSAWGGGGRKGYVQPWRTTANGLEAVAEIHNDGLLCLDELSQCDPREAGEIAYALANGSGKLRMTRSIGARKKLEWELIFLSSGEISLADHVQTSGKRTRAGQEVRLCDLEADAGAEKGVFENIHSFSSPSEFAQYLGEMSRRYYGAPIRAYLAALVDNLDLAAEAIRNFRGDFLKEQAPADASGEVSRVASRFALVAAAGEFATAVGITGWQEGEATEAATILLDCCVLGEKQPINKP